MYLSQFSRRTLLAGTAALPAAAIPAIAAPAADAELVTMGVRYAALADASSSLALQSRRMGLAGPPRLGADMQSNPARRAWEDGSGYEAILDRLTEMDGPLDALGREIMSRKPSTLEGLAVLAKVAHYWLPKSSFFDDSENPVALADVDDYGEMILRQFVETVIALGENREGAI